MKIRFVAKGKPQPPHGDLDKAIRQAVLRRDHHRCVWCGGQENLAVDHIIPRAKGGTNDPRNLQTLCRSCNSSKGHRLVARIGCLDCGFAYTTRLKESQRGLALFVAEVLARPCHHCGGARCLIGTSSAPLRGVSL